MRLASPAGLLNLPEAARGEGREADTPGVRPGRHAPRCVPIFARMTVTNLADARGWFQVLARADQSEAAVMRLESGRASAERPTTHIDSDQILLVVEGEVTAEVGSETRRLRCGDVVIVRAGTAHRFVNTGSRLAVTFNVYAPPAY